MAAIGIHYHNKMKEIVLRYLEISFTISIEVEYIEYVSGMFVNKIPARWIQRIINNINGEDESVPFLYDLHVVFNLSLPELKPYLKEWFRIKSIPFDFEIWWQSSCQAFIYENQKI